MNDIECRIDDFQEAVEDLCAARLTGMKRERRIAGAGVQAAYDALVEAIRLALVRGEPEDG
jgi:hypothetical protein